LKLAQGLKDECIIFLCSDKIYCSRTSCKVKKTEFFELNTVQGTRHKAKGREAGRPGGWEVGRGPVEKFIEFIGFIRVNRKRLLPSSYC
jgi:hypothetical protein